jgi:hypothetical protein
VHRAARARQARARPSPRLPRAAAPIRHWAVGPPPSARGHPWTPSLPRGQRPPAQSRPSAPTPSLQRNATQPNDTDSILQPRQGAVRGKTCHGPCSLAPFRGRSPHGAGPGAHVGASPIAQPTPPPLSSSLALRRRAVFVYSAAYGSNTKGIAETISHEVRGTRWAPGRQGLAAALKAAGAHAPADPGHRRLWVAKPWWSWRARRRAARGGGLVVGLGVLPPASIPQAAAWPQDPSWPGPRKTKPALSRGISLKSAGAAGRPHPGAGSRRQERGR